MTVKLFTPDEFSGRKGLPDVSPYTHKFLAQGDSWFSIGAAAAFRTTNILMELELQVPSCAVNCAWPGATLKRMENSLNAPMFRALLTGRLKWRWDGILMSAGGNDLINLIQVLPSYADKSKLAGKPVPPELRILLRPEEWQAGAKADRYISDAGWQTFSTYLRALFSDLEALRDSKSSDSKGVPVFVHCYDYLLARPAGAGAGKGPWLYPAVNAYKIPQDDWSGLGIALIDRFKTLLNSIQMSNLHVVDTTPGTLLPATQPSGASGDWVNEIHPTAGGYKKLAAKYAAVVDNVMRNPSLIHHAQPAPVVPAPVVPASVVPASVKSAATQP